jgi:hypothetical protein
MNDTADRLERLAAAIREIPVPDRTEGILASLAVLMQRVLETSPDDQAPLAMALAKAMRRD